MSQPALDDLYHALGYLYDLTFGDVCEPEDHAHHLAKARGIAVAALAQAGPLVHHRPAETHVERVRREKREASERTQIRLPVKEHLRQRRDATRARVVAGLAAIDAWEPTLEDAFMALVTMIPTMNEYFEQWKLSAFIQGDEFQETAFVAVSRL